MALAGNGEAVAAAASLSAGTTPAAAASAASAVATTAEDDGVFDHLLPTGCLLRQYFEPDSSTYTYLVGDTARGVGALIDPVDVTAVRDATAATTAGVAYLSHAINTHVHADHVTGTGVLRRTLSPPPRSVLSAAAGGAADVLAPPGWELQLGRLRLTSVATPGHTAGCQSLLLSVNTRGEEVVGGGKEGGEGDATAATAAATIPITLPSAAAGGTGNEDPPTALAAPPLATDPVAVFTGDALLIGGCGRTDFQGGNAATLYRSVRGRLLSLPPATVVLPAHDYHGRRASTVGAERESNARLRDGVSETTFVERMAALQLPMPRRIDEAVPANLRCGV